MTRARPLLLCLVAACMQSHAGQQRVADNDCYSCHATDYTGTTQVAAANPAVPDHLANAGTYSTDCASCHVTTTWYSHPEALFNVLSGPHNAIDCNSCHVNADDNAGDAHGNNTLCVSCHPASEPLGLGTMTTGHSDIAAFSYTTIRNGYTANNFCLSCHPNGREKPHNEAIFPSSHHARNCDGCHDRSKSSDTLGQNADCRRCHRTAHHPEVMSPSGCIASRCHFGGGGGGD